MYAEIISETCQVVAWVFIACAAIFAIAEWFWENMQK